MKNKKYGVIVFEKTENIGDDIQSYAAMKLLPKVDYFIEREAMNEFVSSESEIVNVIMNGWFLHDITSLPPSPFIKPLIISAHFTDHLYKKCPEYLNGYFVEYLKKYQPIGCRDEVIKKYLDDKNIKNYWSGCLTLTLSKFNNIKKEGYICAVDLTNEELNYLKSKTNKEIRVITHSINSKINSKLSYEKRFTNVENLLKKYQGADLIVTSRLHCALPSLALETPVLMICNVTDIDKKNRIGIFLKYLNNCTPNEFITGKMDKYIENPTDNKKDYLKIRNNLIKDVTKFIESKDEINVNEHSEIYVNYFVNQKRYLKKVMDEKVKYDLKLQKDYYENLINKYQKEYDSQIYELNRLVDKYELRQEVFAKEIEIIKNNRNKTVDELYKKLNRAVEELEKKSEKLYKIENSKGYKYLEGFRRFKGKLMRRGKKNV